MRGHFGAELQTLPCHLGFNETTYLRFFSDEGVLNTFLLRLHRFTLQIAVLVLPKQLPKGDPRVPWQVCPVCREVHQPLLKGRMNAA